VQSGRIDLFAQWIQNGYNIRYLYNDTGGTSTAVHTGPTSAVYDESFDVNHPSRT
jgi:hypothetical protein